MLLSLPRVSGLFSKALIFCHEPLTFPPEPRPNNPPLPDVALLDPPANKSIPCRPRNVAQLIPKTFASQLN